MVSLRLEGRVDMVEREIGKVKSGVLLIRERVSTLDVNFNSLEAYLEGK